VEFPETLVASAPAAVAGLLRRLTGAHPLSSFWPGYIHRLAPILGLRRWTTDRALCKSLRREWRVELVLSLGKRRSLVAYDYLRLYYKGRWLANARRSERSLPCTMDWQRSFSQARLLLMFTSIREWRVLIILLVTTLATGIRGRTTRTRSRKPLARSWRKHLPQNHHAPTRRCTEWRPGDAGWQFGRPGRAASVS